MSPTQTIQTPQGKQTVVIKEWITGRDREYIESAMLSGLSAKPVMAGKDSTMDIGKMNMETLINETKHRAIEKFVVSVDGVTEKVVDIVLDMHEEDTDFIMSAIDALGKKKE